MDSNDEEALMALLQAQLVALTALFQAHPSPALLLLRLMQAEARAPAIEHPAYQQTLDSLRSAIAAK
jgi:hypothetical protein